MNAVAEIQLPVAASRQRLEASKPLSGGSSDSQLAVEVALAKYDQDVGEVFEHRHHGDRQALETADRRTRWQKVRRFLIFSSAKPGLACVVRGRRFQCMERR